MSNRNYYVLCDDNCRFPAMTMEQVIAAIAEATGNVPSHIDDAFITKVLSSGEQKNIKFWFGTDAEFNALTPAPIVNPILVRTDTDGNIYICKDDSIAAGLPKVALSTAEITAIFNNA